ncbi:MAG TPA: VacJ family lipoprotein [Steroidobacteraceae bacterium]|nr:VacJ family lipoprotein [Steroidobacteraceae bacterium]
MFFSFSLSLIQRVRLIKYLVLVLAAIGAQGCATPGRTTSDDPWQGVNRGIYKFNDGLDRYALKPTAKAYKKITPSWFRAATGRVLANLEYPVTMVNQLLQGKPLLFLQDTGRFIANTTLGVGGIFDVADQLGMPSHDEDFGQTLAVWGMPSGPYFQIPLLGPSSLRDAPAKVPDYFLRPLRYMDIKPGVDYGETVLDVVDARADLLSSDATLESAYDKYGVLRDAWVQRREYLIFDGNPPEQDTDLEALEREAAEAEAQPADAAPTTEPSDSPPSDAPRRETP